MRAETDKKDKKTSVTMTHEDYNVIEEKAKQRGLKSILSLRTAFMYSEYR